MEADWLTASTVLQPFAVRGSNWRFRPTGDIGSHRFGTGKWNFRPPKIIAGERPMKCLASYHRRSPDLQRSSQAALAPHRKVTI
jgi:hypothetical protein